MLGEFRKGCLYMKKELLICVHSSNKTKVKCQFSMSFRSADIVNALLASHLCLVQPVQRQSRLEVVHSARICRPVL
jgi:hypothetical protein